MPQKTYMVVDERHDHSFRIPRPDLATSLGTPDTCTSCHSDRDAAWAAAAADRFWGKPDRPHYGEAIAAGRRRGPTAATQLLRMINDPETPAIARATALTLLPGLATPAPLPVILTALGDEDPLVRLGAIEAIEAQPPAERSQHLTPLLTDPVRAVRLAAASSLAGVPRQLLQPAASGALEGALEEYRASQALNADRPQAHLNLAVLLTRSGRFADAEREYGVALGQAPEFIPTYINLADLYRATDRDPDGEELLRSGILLSPSSGELHHALGLLLVRDQRHEEALEALAEAARLRPDEVRYGYVLGVALESNGRIDEAMEALRATHTRHPGSADVLLALVSFNQKYSRRADALVYGRRLLELDPSNQQVAGLVRELEN